MIMRTLLNILFAALAIVLCVGCGEKEVCADGSCVCAQIIYRPVGDDCGCFMISVETAEGEIVWYKPQNLPEEFQVDGQFVWLSFSETGEWHNCGFGGYVAVIYVEQIKWR